MHPKILIVAAVAALAIVPAASIPSAVAQGCPANSEPVPGTETQAVVHCRCVAGYENQGGVCEATVAPQPPPAAQQQIAELCSSLDDETRELHAVNLRIVQLHISALGKLLHVPVALWGEAEEPPEDVLREAREHLQKIASINEQIDVLSGKKAWTERQRAWVRQHIYVASPAGNYAVNGSVATARGQTDFSSLIKMPVFAGCVQDTQGRVYIPKY